MSDRKAGFIVGVAATETQKSLLRCGIRSTAAWEELEQIQIRQVHLLDEMSRELGLSDWIFYIKTNTGEVVLERRKTEEEIARSQHQKELLSEEVKEEGAK